MKRGLKGNAEEIVGSIKLMGNDGLRTRGTIDDLVLKPARVTGPIHE